MIKENQHLYTTCNTVRVGILHSLTGTMAVSEASLKDAEQMAIAEINQAGGVLGKIIEPVIEDGESEPEKFAIAARKLLQKDKVATVFGCWTSDSRKAILPLLEEQNALLWYPVQYEGLECSKNIFYSGACPNQQVEPALDWLLQNKRNKFYLLGSNYVFPRTVNKIIKAHLKRQNGIVVGEEYVPLGANDFNRVITKIKQAKPDVVFSTLNGDSNIPFYQQYKEAGIAAEDIPILAVSVAEDEIRKIGGEVAVGHYATWSYFQSLDTPRNRVFVKNFKEMYGADRVTSDPIEAAYSQVYLWKQAVEKAQDFDVDRVRRAAYGQIFEAPRGLITVEKNNHISKICRIGKILSSGQFKLIFASGAAIKPLPWLLGVEDLNLSKSPVVIDILAEVSPAIEYSCQLEQKSREVEAEIADLEHSISLLYATLESTPDAILVVNEAGKIVDFNQKFLEMWGIPKLVITCRDDNKILEFVFEQLKDPESFLKKIVQLYAQPEEESYDFLEFKDGRIFERYSLPQQVRGKVVGRVWSFRDITERRRAEEIIRYQALHDLLTGLPNRTLFDDRLSVGLANAHRSQDMLAVMFLDLDRFKIVNDTLGHAMGDRLLKEVAERLKSCVREGDTLARWGGDEFILLLPKISSKKEATAIAQRILEALKPDFNIQGQELRISLSIGIAAYPCDGDNSETLLKNADLALYRAKEDGRNTYELYTLAMSSKVSQFLALENSMQLALERGEFRVYYQPQVNIATGAIARMEALVRWQHPEFGLVFPGTFMTLAEETGLIVPLGEWVLWSACAQNKAWQNAGLPPLRVAVNLSARQFQQPDLVEVVGRTLSETGLAPEYLDLEITETVTMQNLDFTQVVLPQLYEIGLNLSLDDFGKGYSSLGYLKQFPFDTLKIDRSFIRELTSDAKNAAILTVIIALSNELNLKVVAEGVETTEQKDLLRSLNCEEMQGYLLSRPIPAKEATELLRNSSGKIAQTSSF